MTKTVTSKSFALNAWGDGTRRSAPEVSGRKWYPGHYARTNQQPYATTAYLNARKAEYDTTEGYDEIVGIAFAVPWGTVETSEGVYDWTYVDAEIDYIDSLGKKAFVQIRTEGYGGSVPSAPYSGLDKWVPNYGLTAGYAGNRTDGGWGADYADADCVTRIIAFIEALADRYDSDPRVAAFGTTETSTIVTVAESTALAQWKRIVDALEAYWVQTPTFLYNNYLYSIASTKSLSDYAAAALVGLGGPDIYTYDSPDNCSWGASIARGAGGSFGSTDYRTVVPQSFEMQVIRNSSLTPTAINTRANDDHKNNFTVWTMYVGTDPAEYGPPYATVSAFRWESGGGVRQFVNDPDNAVANTDYPSGY
ncbi:MAG: hypothetical protein IT178_16525 [Acidobacteria bacterium]|nr:hypothetical protein [Acidobacteriota bacterium]